MSKMKRYDELSNELMFLEDLHDTLHAPHCGSDDTPAEVKMALKLINSRLKVIGKKAKKLSRRIAKENSKWEV